MTDKYFIAGLNKTVGFPKYHSWIKQEKERKESKIKQQQQQQGQNQGQAKEINSSFSKNIPEREEERVKDSSVTSKHLRNTSQNTETDSSFRSHSRDSGAESAVTSHPDTVTIPAGLTAWHTPEQLQGTGLPIFPPLQGHFYY